MRLLRMRPWLKRTLQITASVVLLIAAGFGAILYSVVGGNTKITDGATPAPDVRIIKDGVVDFGVVDVGEGHVVLIDAGYDPKAAALLAELARRKVGPDAVTAIFFTHGHPDHIAGASLWALLTAPARTWSTAAGAPAPVFNAGRTRATVRLAASVERELVIDYERAIYRALR